MKTSPIPPLSPSVDRVFLALGQALYTCQLFETTMLEILATAHELLDGTGDGKQFQSSIETLSRHTLGQLLHALRKRSDIRSDIDAQLNDGLEARNFVVHRFAEHVGDDLTNDSKILAHQKALYEKCMIVMDANSTALAVLHAVGRLNSERSSKAITELEQTANALRELAKQYAKPRH